MLTVKTNGLGIGQPLVEIRLAGHHWVFPDGGREWESNPPETASLPHPDLKSGHATGHVSPPNIDFIAISQKSNVQTPAIATALLPFAFASVHCSAADNLVDLRSSFSCRPARR